MADTSIAWTDKVWNPVTGCSKVSAGCKHCYAERMFGRNLPGMNGQKFNEIRCHEDRLEIPLHWRPVMEHSEECKCDGLTPYSKKAHLARGCKERSLRIFVNSMSDLFHESVPDEFIDRVFAIMALCPQHTFQVLTKRPEGMWDYWFLINSQYRLFHISQAIDKLEPVRTQSSIAAKERLFEGGPILNVQLGVSVESPKHLDRIDILRRIPAALRFVSFEPLLEDLGIINLEGIDWVICGGESGPGARPCNVEWLRSIVEHCKAAWVPCFAKQLGARAVEPSAKGLMFRYTGAGGKKWGKGADPAEWPADLRVQQFPEVRRG